jgi:hypothetical protein
MAKTLQQYLAEQDAAVIASFLDIRWCICAATSRADLDDLAAKRGGTAETLAGYEEPDAAVVRFAGRAELWVRARASGAVYRGAFAVFAAALHGFATTGVPAGYNVDHLFSKGRVQTGGTDPDVDDRLPHATLVRMLLVASSVNQSFGGLMEGAMIGSGNKARPYRRFTYFQLVKALSIDANSQGGGLSGPNQAVNFAHIVNELDKRGVLAGLGMSSAEMMRSLMNQAATVAHYRAQP